MQHTYMHIGVLGYVDWKISVEGLTEGQGSDGRQKGKIPARKTIQFFFFHMSEPPIVATGNRLVSRTSRGSVTFRQRAKKLAIKRHHWRTRESATPWGLERSFFEIYALTTVLRRQVANPEKCPDTQIFSQQFVT